MEGLLTAPYTGYVYPNEMVIPWTLMIAIYPYLTGLVAGAFTVSSMHHAFGMERFKPVARFALLTSLSCMLFVPLPLILHLGHPERAFNAMITPHLSSAFAMFGFFAAFYVVLLALECWFAFRADNVARARSSTGLLRTFYRAITLWSDDVSTNALAYDRKWLLALAIIGIPGAHGLHGYVGFVYGSLKSREWWGSDMMPVVFIFSAIISGMALCIVLYVIAANVRRIKIDFACLKGMAYTLWGFMMFTLLLE
ncbi:MAG: polysulfide reductase NrfD, partial [Gammaproteobacteria bacterium]|nr:polysulfide reductase NrfD [Gammaproteobacteria bacterium]